MREKLNTLSVAELRELAKGQGRKGTGAMRKQELIDWLAERWEQQTRSREAETSPAAQKSGEAQENGDRLESRSDLPEKQTLRKNRNSLPEKQEQEESRSDLPEKQALRKNRNSLPEKQEQQKNRAPWKNYERREQTVRKPLPSSQPEESVRPTVSPQTEQRTGIAAGGRAAAGADAAHTIQLPEELQGAADRGPLASGILEVMQEGYGFIRSENYMPGEDDIYVSPSQIRRFDLKTGDIVSGVKRIRAEKEKFAALLYVSTVNGLRPAELSRRRNFEDMTPIFPDERIHLETDGASMAMRIVDLISPVGKGQRGMIVSPPKAGKTTLLKQIAKVVTDTIPDMHLIILLIDERPEEVTDIKEYIEGPQVEVIYSTFDREPEQHKRVSEMVIERAKRLVEQHRDVMILLDSITRLARAYNLTVMPSGRTLSGGLDPAALYMPKRFFGAARNMREGGSLTILATALVDTGSRMDDVVYEEFKGTGNMELVLDRKLSERRVFPAVDILKSGTRRDDLLLSPAEREVADMIHRMTSGARPEDSVERILNRFANTRSNAELIRNARLAKNL